MIFSKPDITGIILAGGQSRRMGFNKAEAAMHGRSMLIRMIDKLSTLTSNIIISIGPTTYSNINWPQIPDVYPNCGPLGGIYSVLKTSTTPFNLVVSCDMPLISVSLLHYIVARAAESEAILTAPVDEDGQLQLLCAVYHKDIVPVLEQQIEANALKMKSLTALVEVENVSITKEHPLYHQHAFKNVNTPRALKETRELWKGH